MVSLSMPFAPGYSVGMPVPPLTSTAQNPTLAKKPKRNRQYEPSKGSESHDQVGIVAGQSVPYYESKTSQANTANGSACGV